jgi:predicted enzyme related to lactoylglutathione lyase
LVVDSVVHFEIPAKDPKRASLFYNKAFGWQFSRYPNFEYWRIGTTLSDENGMPTSPGAINGGMGKKSDALRVPTVTIGVANIDAALKKVSRFGGKVIAKKQAIGGNMGFTAYFLDTEGNVIGLYQYPTK